MKLRCTLEGKEWHVHFFPLVAFRLSEREYYDVVGMRWSPDGTMLAVEAHSAQRSP